MTPQEIQLVRSSFARVAPFADQAAALFYARLFELEPALRGLLPGEMAARGAELTAALAAWLADIDRAEKALPAARALGLRPTPVPGCAAPVEAVGTALLWTLEKGLGPDFTPEIRAAWAKAYWRLAEALPSGGGNPVRSA